MLVPLSEIRIKKRVRKDLGDLEPLKDSMKRYGLLNPITLNARKELIAGRRRLEAARQLGWSGITANIVDVKDTLIQLEMELEENTQRTDFTGDDLLSGYERLNRLKNPGVLRRILNAIKRFFVRLFKLDR
ncbi:MAG: ParB N-terminal domain-containing protein [Spirochaetaceae bacterium]|jgi:ParB family chromosome partitioning protein|nr:ParB N-terminal domain-containing protein [Spirochaetaceae bacterium]